MAEEENPILLQRVMVVDDGYFQSLTLFPPQALALPKSEIDRRCIRIVLGRRKRRLWDLLLFSPLGSLQKQLAQAAISLRPWWPPSRFVGYLLCRVKRVVNERNIKAIDFHDPPSFKFIWAEAEKSVALLLNGAPWAFISSKGVGYSKGLLRSEYAANTWDEKLFAQTFV